MAYLLPSCRLWLFSPSLAERGISQPIVLSAGLPLTILVVAELGGDVIDCPLALPVEFLFPVPPSLGSLVLDPLV